LHYTGRLFLKEITVKKLILLATIAVALVGGTAVLMTVRPAVACATWHCGCQDDPAAHQPACRE
jgi:hypothetical protein